MTIAGQTSIAIVGGGIGGLTAATLLLRAGFDVQVYEQAKVLGEVGAGINIGPNAFRLQCIREIIEISEESPIKWPLRRE